MFNNFIKKHIIRKKNKKSVFSFLKKKDIHTLETIYIASLLSIVGGYVDAYTYITREGVFAYAQTGNIIFLAINLANAEFNEAVNCLFPILSFIFGIWFAQYIKKTINGKHIIEWGYIILLINTAILFAVGLFSKNFPNAAAVSLIAFISAVQMTTFNKVEGLSYVTNMCTGNLKSASEHLFHFLFSKDKNAMKNGFKYLTIILFFTIGAYFGALFTDRLGYKSIWIPAGILLFADSFAFFEHV